MTTSLAYEDPPNRAPVLPLYEKLKAQDCLGSRSCLHCIYDCHHWKSSGFSVRLILWLQSEVRVLLRFHSDFHCIDRLVMDCCELFWLDHISHGPPLREYVSQ